MSSREAAPREIMKNFSNNDMIKTSPKATGCLPDEDLLPFVSLLACVARDRRATDEDY